MAEMIGQCLDCGRTYPATEDTEGHIPYPEDRQPPWSDDNPDWQRTSYAGHRKHIKASHGYCRDCARRRSPHLQMAGPEKGAKMLGESREEAAGHWWWRRIDVPKRPRKG